MYNILYDIIEKLDKYAIRFTMALHSAYMYFDALKCLIIEGIKGWYSWLFSIERVGQDLIYERQDVCFRCPKRRDFYAFSQCKECKCVIEIKTTIASSQCPLGKW